MAEETATQTTPQEQTTTTPATEGALPFQNASREGLRIISKGGVEVPETATNIPPESNNPPATASPGAVPTEAKADASPQAPETTPSPATEPSTGEPGPQEPAVEPDLIALLSDRSGGKITKPEDALALVDEVTQLRTQLAERPKIEFPNDQARQIYEFAQKFPGLEMAAAKNLLHVHTLPIDKLEAKEAQFEAFALKKPNWTREQAREYFEEKYEKAYGSGVLETSRMAQLDHDEETAQARAELAKYQQDFAAAKPSQPASEQQTPQLTSEQVQEIQRQVEEVTKDFGGVRYQFVQNDPNSTVNIQMEKSALQKFQSYMVDPGEFLKDLAAECTENGVFSQVKYRDAMFEFANRKKIREQVFNQGKVYGEISIIKERKNTATPKTSTDTPAPVQKPATFKDAFRAAVKGQKV